MRGGAAEVALLLLSVFAYTISVTASTPLVSFSVFPSWVTPPNPQGQGTVGLTVVYSAAPNAVVLAVKVDVFLPRGVTNSTGGSSVTAFFTGQTPVTYDFDVDVGDNVTNPLVFKAVLTFYVSYGNRTVVETGEETFTLPYYGRVGAAITSSTPFVHFGFNEVPLTVVNNGTIELLNVTLRAGGQTVSVERLGPHSEFTTRVTVYVPPSDALGFDLPVNLTYRTPYGTEATLYEVLHFVVLENYSTVAVSYYDFLSPNPHYLDVGENYIEFNITNYLGVTVNSSWLLVLENNSVIRAYFVNDWRPLQNVTVFVAINTSSPLYFGFELYNDGRVYNLTSLWIPIIYSPKLALNLTVAGGKELLEVMNDLTVNVTNVTIVGPGVNVTYSVIEPGHTVTVKLNQTNSTPIYVKYTAMNVTVTEYRLIQLESPDLVVYYYAFKSTDPHVLLLTVGVINKGDVPIYNAYLLLNLNSTAAQLNPYVIHIGALQPNQAFYQAVGLYMTSPLPKVVVIPAQVVYNDGPDLMVKNYTLVVNVYSIYNYNNNPIVILLEYLSYSVDGIPLIFIAAIVALIIILLIPRRRKRS